MAWIRVTVLPAKGARSALMIKSRQIAGTASLKNQNSSCVPMEKESMTVLHAKVEEYVLI